MPPKNLTFIKSAQCQKIASELTQLAITGAHFTNGTFAYDHKITVPTTLAGFKRVTKIQPHLPLIIAVNSDKSMLSLGKPTAENQSQRAEKVALPLAQLFPDNQVIVVYYDEKTPNHLYETLKEKGLTRTLHKWGYGTSRSEPKIEGAEYFELVYAFPLPNNGIKPLCYDCTNMMQTTQNIIIDDLRNYFITKEGVLFDLPETLKSYQADLSEKKTSCLTY